MIRKILKKVTGILTCVSLMAGAMGMSITTDVHADEHRVTITLPSDYKDAYDANKLDVQVDGDSVTITPTANANEFELTVSDNTKFITAFIYKTTDTDTSGIPQSMAVWEVTRRTQSQSETSTSESTGETSHNTEEAVTMVVNRLSELDDILGYVGFAIKPPSSNKSGGLRCSLSISNDLKQNGLVKADGAKEYTVLEYGHLHVLSRNWNAQSKDHMTIGDDLVLKAACYKKGEFDYVLRTEGGRTVFANSLYDIVDYNVVKNFRGYVKLHKEATNEDVYLYGPVVGRNPYYVAQKILEKNTDTPAIIAFSQEVVNYVEGEAASAAAQNAKNVFFIGDSIMMGTTLKDGVSQTGPTNVNNYKQVGRQPSVQIGEALATRLNAKINCTLIANGGATYSEPGANLYNMPDFARRALNQGKTPDYIFLMAGVNDWAHEDQGEYFNNKKANFGVNYNGTGVIYNEFNNPYSPTDKSYCIGVDRTLKILLDDPALSNTKIIVCSPLRARWVSGPGTVVVNASTGKTLSDYVHVQETVANKYHNDGQHGNVYYIDLYDKILTPMGLPTSEGSVPEDASNFRSYFPDGYHPNQAGYDVMCSVIIDEMTRLGIIPAAGN